MPEATEGEATRLHVDGHVFDPEDLSFGEKREVRRLCRELWDEDTDGPFDWDEIGENEVLPATIAVFMRREDPHYTMDQALKCKSRDVYGEGAGDPPTPPASAKPASVRKRTSAAAGSPS